MHIVSGDFRGLLSGDVCVAELWNHLCFFTAKYRWCMTTSVPAQELAVRWGQCGFQSAHSSVAVLALL